jgi:hypothetical protein
MTAVRFSSKPMTRVIIDNNGDERVVRRRPAEKKHLHMPEDKVELGVKHGDSFEEGASYTVKHISRQDPNILQLENSKGETTFVPYFEVDMTDAPESVRGKLKQSRQDIEHPLNTKYLRWP